MKKLLISLLLFSTVVQAQFSGVDLTPVTKRLDNIENRLKALETGKPVVVKKDCKRGPTIVDIRNVTGMGFEAQFDADSVTNIKYMVTGSKVYIDSIKPTKNTFAVVFPTQFPNGTYTFSIEGLNCNGSNSRIFTIAGGVDPPSAAKCDIQPTFKINGFTDQAATIQFDARKLEVLTLKVVQGSNVFKSTTYKPDVNTLFFPFDQTLPAGNYQITLTPVSCTADVASQNFTINKDDAGTVTPPVVVPPVVTDPGSVEYKMITQGMPGHMSVTRTTNGEYDLITDNTANPLQPNYRYYYMVGSELISQSTPLKNYAVPRNNGFRVVKFNKKNTTQTMNEWPGQGETPEPGGYYKADAGQSFQYNATAAVTTGFYSGSQSGFVNHIPANYKPETQMPQWADIMPEAQLPNGRFFVLTRSDWPIDQVLRKGMTHIRHNEIPRPNGDETLAFQLRLQGKTYSDVPLSTTIFGGKPSDNPSKEEVQRMIDRHVYPDALHIGETMEQSHAIRPESHWLYDFNLGFVNNQKKIFDSKGIKSLNCFNYFQFWPNSYHLGQVSADSSKKMFRLTPDKMPYSNFSPGAPLSSTNLIVEAVYLGSPDVQQNQPNDLAFKLMLFEHMGYTGGVFLAGEHEWRPNNFFEYVYPEGKYYSQGKIPLDPNTIITSAFLSQVFGKVFVQWGGTGKVNAGRIFDSRSPEPTYYQPNGSNELKGSYRNPDPNADRYSWWLTNREFPHQKIPGPGYYGYNAGTDLCRFGLQVYLDTWFKIPEDGSKNFLSYRIDNGAWINAENQFADDIIDASVQQRGYVYSIHKAGQIAWYYLNSFGDNKWHDLEVKFPNGRTSRTRVSGNGIHAKIESL